ncbi:MAG: phosphoglucosamine mutase [Acidobacteriota bacterium]|nr:phosphoglucosamine mutase [Acidobacteriota bacterium]MDH3528188.1 phosphoglucosamine mutase [Acidobacteriota bacterium]
MSQLFGTDGIRGSADKYPLDSETVWIIGKTLANHIGREKGKQARFISGRDTRESGPRIENAFGSGVMAAGGWCESAGILTTPGIAFLTGSLDFDAGVVISASHNSFEDNGIKLFSPSGRKLGREVEIVIESAVDAHEKDGFEPGVVDSARSEELQQFYLNHFLEDFGGLNLSGMRIIADCANGAASHLAPSLFELLGAEVKSIFSEPDGQNINRDCGSLHLEKLQRAMSDSGADFGVAFDGDADRSLFVDEKGVIVDGDAVLWIMANFLRDKKKLKDNVVVSTVMSNIGLEIALRERSIKLVRTAVGDKYVLAELLKSGATIGGEQSGHIIFPERSLVGDGMQTALFLLQAIIETGRPFSELRSGFSRLPQTLVNVRVSSKPPLEEIAAVRRGKDLIESQLGSNGRLLLRYSGTENLARVMIEGSDQADIEEKAAWLAGVIADVLA